MILEQPKFRSQTHLKSGFKKYTDAHNPRFPTHKKGTRCARASLNLEVLSLTLTTTSEFWCSGRDFNEDLNKKNVVCNTDVPK